MNILLLAQFDKYMETIVNFLTNFSQNKHLCYITLNKPYVALTNDLKARNVNMDNLFVIDCITKTVIEKPKSVKKGFFVSSPVAFNEIASTLDKICSKKQIVVFDSVSTQLIYSEEKEVINFIERILKILSSKGCEGIFPCLKEDLDREILKKLDSKLDKVLDKG